MTVFENLEMGAEKPGARRRVAHNYERVYRMFPRLKEPVGQRAGTLSGGEQQMLAVARRLMAEPEVLMIDEISLGLPASQVMERATARSCALSVTPPTRTRGLS